MTHVAQTEKHAVVAVDNHGQRYDTHETMFRWRCSCGRAGGWVTSERVARRGADLHFRRSRVG